MRDCCLRYSHSRAAGWLPPPLTPGPQQGLFGDTAALTKNDLCCTLQVQIYTLESSQPLESTLNIGGEKSHTRARIQAQKDSYSIPKEASLPPLALLASQTRNSWLTRVQKSQLLSRVPGAYFRGRYDGQTFCDESFSFVCSLVLQACHFWHGLPAESNANNSLSQVYPQI